MGRKWVGAIVVVVILAISLIGVLVWHSRGAHSDSGGRAAGRANPTVSRSEAHAVAAALIALPNNPQRLVAADAEATVAGQARRAIPAGTTVAPDEKSWRPDGVGGGTMLLGVQLRGQLAVTYLAVMVREAGNWKILATMPVPAATPAGVTTTAHSAPPA